MGEVEQNELLLMRSRVVAYEHRISTLQKELYAKPTVQIYSMLCKVHMQWQNFKVQIAKRLKELEEMVELQAWENEVMLELSRQNIPLKIYV